MDNHYHNCPECNSAITVELYPKIIHEQILSLKADIYCPKCDSTYSIQHIFAVFEKGSKKSLVSRLNDLLDSRTEITEIWNHHCERVLIEKIMNYK